MPIPSIGNDPTGTPEFDALVARLKNFIAQGHGEIFAQLTVEEHEIIIALCYHNELGVNILAQQLRHFATVTLDGAQRWSERKAIRAIRFKDYLDQAAVWRAQVQRNAAQIINLNERRGQRARGALAELNPAVMVNMSSPRLRAVGLLRQQRDGRLWSDTFSNQFMADWNGTDDSAAIAARRIDDEFYLNVALWFAQQDEKLGGLSIRTVIECVHTAAAFDKRNAPRDWLNGLTWDCIERLESVFSRGYGAADNEFNRAAGRCWFVSMVARILRPGCQLDTMPVLIGPQGIFKSQSLRLIGGDWYSAAQSPIHAKDFLQELWGVLVLEIPELHSIVTSNASAAKAKAVISIQVDRFRKSYGYAPGEFRRTACMVGTTNNRDWHHDESGEARRFWPIHCGVIDLDWIRENRTQLFAEALVYFNLPDLPDGTHDPRSLWWNVPHDAQRDLMAGESSEDVWQAIITRRLSEGGYYRGQPGEAVEPWDGHTGDSAAWGNIITTTRIAYQWLGLNPAEAGRRSSSNRIGVVMRMAGWKRTRIRMPGLATLPWGWISDGNSDENDEPVTPPPVPDEDDIPF